jgi:GTP cyclohydrolase I
MKDIQNSRDSRNLNIDKVGIKDLRYPVVVLDRTQSSQHVTALINMCVDLPHEFKGTHMSRFVEVLNEFHGLITIKNMYDVLHAMQERLNAEKTHFSMNFVYFLDKTAPVSGRKSKMEYEVTFEGNLDGSELDFVLQVKVPVTTLCPCSKEISAYGAHNQRSFITIAVRFSDFVWIEELIEIAEKEASCELYSLLKRPDEKYVTEKAYDNPKFVEDIVRDVSLNLLEDDRIVWFRVEAENHESIHSHNAYALIERDKREKSERKV